MPDNRRKMAKTHHAQFAKTPATAKNPLLKHARAKKSLGQNFLIDQSYIDKIIAELDPQPGETIIEIGPGRGALTNGLIESQATIIAIEIDRELISLLQNQFGEKDNFKLVHEDVLTIDFFGLKQNFDCRQKVKIVANLPYYISTAILSKLIAERQHFSAAILMLQQEVAERIIARPGNSERGFLTVLVEAFSAAEKLFNVPPTAFRPEPKVSSSIVKIIFAEKLEKSWKISDRDFMQIVGAGFAQKRKTILNNLKNSNLIVQDFSNQKEWAAQILERAQIEFNRRAETLSLGEWVRLAEAVYL